MNRSRRDLMVDLLLGLCLLGLIMTGLVVGFILPPGSGTRESLGLTRHQWGDVHWWIACAFLVLVVLHLVLHWRWVCAAVGDMLLRRPDAGKAMVKQRTFLGAVVILVALCLLGGFLYLTARSAASSKPAPRQQHRATLRVEAAPRVMIDAQRSMMCQMASSRSWMRASLCVTGASAA